MAKLVAKGGGDECEDVLGALMEVTRMSWTGRARFCVLVCDAPGHGLDLHDSTVRDSKPAGIKGVTAQSTMQALREKDIELLVCHLRPKSTSMVFHHCCCLPLASCITPTAPLPCLALPHLALPCLVCDGVYRWRQRSGGTTRTSF
jgi:hypothetical protein